MENEKIYGMPFAKIYPLLVNKAVRKGRTVEEVNQVITWLTGYNEDAIRTAEQNGVTYGDFFRQAPARHPNRSKITGSVCGVKLSAITDPLMLEIRYLDKLIDELAKGKSMDQILRQ